MSLPSQKSQCQLRFLDIWGHLDWQSIVFQDSILICQCSEERRQTLTSQAINGRIHVFIDATCSHALFPAHAKKSFRMRSTPDESVL